ncbi:hypothetical protein CTI12_AA406970 [Artemisia annua]|uniref:Uncharacterized protein n=1 Tax=Artemisia annua TaxID=35608 RepID=A0A2U1M8U7_ARTAN|nr:hypothetical protein CTI12_AA406970 [Artemisia annua]
MLTTESNWLFDEETDDGFGAYGIWISVRVGFEKRKMKKGMMRSSGSSSSSSLSSASLGCGSIMEWESIKENEIKGPMGFSLLARNHVSKTLAGNGRSNGRAVINVQHFTYMPSVFIYSFELTHMYASGGIAVSCVVVPITQIGDPQPKCEDESGLHMNESELHPCFSLEQLIFFWIVDSYVYLIGPFRGLGNFHFDKVKLITYTHTSTPYYSDIKVKLHAEMLLKTRAHMHQHRIQIQGDKGDGSDAESGAPEEDIIIQDEIYKSRLASIKREEDGYVRERDRYELEKGWLIREMKRIRDEDGSRFNNY